MRTPRTVKILSNDNYSFTSSKFSVFPNYDYDTLDLPNQCQYAPTSSPFPPSSAKIQTFTNNTHNNENEVPRSMPDELTDGLAMALKNNSNDAHQSSLHIKTINDIEKLYPSIVGPPQLGSNSSDPIPEYPSMYQYEHRQANNLQSPPSSFPYYFQMIGLDEISDDELSSDEEEVASAEDEMKVAINQAKLHPFYTNNAGSKEVKETDDTASDEPDGNTTNLVSIQAMRS
ncbi:unnamed protein product [Ambrosiozyma monospora]|uniref:Unnamed protein product n=1 Tax=Ambrosiozyma monospora TaxID=43982 RepID=A0ACB5UA52_AMBMO|nr:unnamed protein product [Ambrosiozyma monospora]